MRLDGIHHITATTADREACARFYAGVLGLATIDGPAEEASGAETISFGDELGRPGSILTFLVHPGVRPGRAAAGSVHRIGWRVADYETLGFWERRLADAGVEARWADQPGDDPSLRFADPEGLAHELVPDSFGDEPLVARSREISPHRAIRGIDGVHAFCRSPGPSADLLAGRLEFATAGERAFRVEGRRRARYAYEPAPRGRAVGGAGTVHHVAWSCEASDQPAWRQRVLGMGARVSPLRKLAGLTSLWFREPSGVLFELASGEPYAATIRSRPPRLAL